MMELYNAEFPLLTQKDKDVCLHEYFKRQYIVFAYKWNRITDIIPIDKDSMSISLLHVLRLLKKLIQKHGMKSEWGIYLKQYYRLMAFTRDGVYGKGEHDLSYRMILVWYLVFPVLAIYFIHQLPMKYGSWRDLPYLCEHVYRTYKGSTGGDGLIDCCIEIMNNQFRKDLKHYDLGEYELISYVAKWIPREYKKMDWLYLRCVLHWAKENTPHLLHSAVEYSSFCKALLKCKGEYRKKMALLNRFLDTSEIKQCSREHQLLNSKNVSKYTLAKCSDLDYVPNILSEKLSSLFVSTDKYSFQEEKTSIMLPISYYIKRAFHILDREMLGENMKRDKELLNKQWMIYSKIVLPKSIRREPIIPFLDVSFEMQQDTEVFYTAFGMALLVAQKSSIGNGKRILAMGQNPIWIDFSSSCSLVESVSIIRNYLAGIQKTFVNFQKAIDLIQSAICQNVNYYMYVPHIVVFSTFAFSFQQCSPSTLCRPLKNSNGTPFEFSTGNSTDNLEQAPHRGAVSNLRWYKMTFWNLDRGGNDDDDTLLDFVAENSSIRLYSGYSVNFLKELFVGNLEKVSDSRWDVYESICDKIPFERYRILDDYFTRCVSQSAYVA